MDFMTFLILFSSLAVIIAAIAKIVLGIKYRDIRTIAVGILSIVYAIFISTSFLFISSENNKSIECSNCNYSTVKEIKFCPECGNELED